MGPSDLSSGKRTVITTSTTVYMCGISLVESVLTALDVNSASGVVLSQWVLHHTCVIPRILQFCSADLDSGVFPMGDNTCTAESGESGQGGNSMETQQVETWGTERQTTGQAAAWQQVCFTFSEAKFQGKKMLTKLRTKCCLPSILYYKRSSWF